MNPDQARQLVDTTFQNDFDRSRFRVFISSLLDGALDTAESFDALSTETQGVFHYKHHERIKSYEKVGSFQGDLDVLIVELQRGVTLQKGRTTLREFAADYLVKGQGLGRSGILAAFFSKGDDTWRFSYVKVDVSLAFDEKGRIKEVYQKSEAKRFSFLVGKNERTHTARKQFLPLLTVTRTPTIEELENAFSIEVVTDDFFADYNRVFKSVEDEVQRSIPDKENRRLFTQRLFNRLMFIYFLQKKGWLLFKGDKNYLRRLYIEAVKKEENYLRDRLYWLFFYGLSHAGKGKEPKNDEFLAGRLGDVPYLNGGLFEIEAFDDRKGVTIDNFLFHSILELFELYNFTVDESTPLDIELAVDPEMLGKVFEELVTGRHDTGSYYTPRQIVQFMCRETLKGYLAETKIDSEKIRKLVEEYNVDNITLADARALLAYLAHVKIVDPACGSGAYLLGALQELKNLTTLLDTRSGNAPVEIYKRKLSIIQNNLYGVDADSFAVQIARLRLWLSLAVDYSGRKPQPLPNLDFKIEKGDSLTAPDPQKANLGPVQKEIDRYKKAKAEYFQISIKHGDDLDRKKRLQDEIRSLHDHIAFWIHSNRTGKTPEGTFDWAIEFAEVFSPKVIDWQFDGTRPLIEGYATQPKLVEAEAVESATRDGGFDIVLANPPYGAKVGEKVRDLYFDRHSEGSQSKDTYGLFMTRGLQLLRPNGVLSYIVSDTWRTLGSHKPLRRRILDSCVVKHFVDLPAWVFDATVTTSILTVIKQKAPEDHNLIAGDLRNIQKRNWRLLEENLRVVAERGFDAQTPDYARYTYAQGLISGHSNLSFFVASPRLYALMSDNRFTKMGALADVKQGLATADNHYYLRQRKNVRGTYKLLDERQVLTDLEIAGLTEREKLNGINPEKYNGKHFLPYDKGGESNASGGWLPNYFVPTGYFIDWSVTAVNRLRNATVADVKRRKGKEDDISERDEERIASRFQNSQYYFRKGLTYSPTGFYAPTFRVISPTPFDKEGSGIFFQNADLNEFLGLLCSLLSRYFSKQFVNHTVHAMQGDIDQIPINTGSTETLRRIGVFVNTIIEKQTGDLLYPYHLHEQKEIDDLVYGLYGLTEEDIREIEIWYCRRYPILADAQGFTAEVSKKYKDYLNHCELLLSKPPEYWTSHPIKQLIAQFENHRLDFKEFYGIDKFGSTAGDPAKSTLKAVASFINAEGGTLLIGVDDPGNIKGIRADLEVLPEHTKDAFEQKIRNTIHARLKPDPTGLIEITFQDLPEGTVCQIDIKPSKIPTYFDGKLYVRDGNGAREKTLHELTMWIQERTRPQ